MQGPKEFLQLLRVVVSLVSKLESDPVSSNKQKTYGMSCMLCKIGPLSHLQASGIYQV